jgi:deazaflavin-dependent oxidoreductase (nitroreductase family)
MANPFAKSKTFYKLGNLLALPLWSVLPTPPGLGVVTTTGRKSGKSRARAMRVVRDGDSALAVSILGRRSDWFRNVQSDPKVTVKLGTKTYRGNARAIVDPLEREKARNAYEPVAGWYDYFDYASFVWAFPTTAKLLRTHNQWFDRGAPVVIELQGS